MTKKFAKLFERNGVQVLVRVDEDEPALVFTFKSPDDTLWISPKLAFKGPTEEISYYKAYLALDRVDEDAAFNIMSDSLKSLFGGER